MKLEHVLIEKVEQLFLDMLERHSSVPPSRKKSGAYAAKRA